MKKLSQNDSRVEIKGIEAKYYDLIIDLMSLGTYRKFIKKAISKLNLKKGERILDFGAGTGRNEKLMLNYIGSSGEIVALEISDEMIKNFNKNCGEYSNIKLFKKRIEGDLEFANEFDLVLISFVLHGFIQKYRDKILSNAYKALKNTGRLAVLDYSEFDVNKANLIVKTLIRKLECPLAEDFINRNAEDMLKKAGFKRFEYHYFFNKYVRLIIAFKS